MKNKKKLMYRICALLCALFVSISVVPIDVFRASETSSSDVVSYLKRIGLYDFYVEKFDFEYNSNYKYFVGINYFNYTNTYRVFLREYKGEPTFYIDSQQRVCGNCKGGCTNYSFDVNYVDGSYRLYPPDSSSTSSYYIICGDDLEGSVFDNYIFYTDLDIYDSKDKKYTVIENGTSWNTIRFDFRDDMFTVKPSENYNSNLGYLKNVKRVSTYVRGVLYNYDEESLTYHFYHDLSSTTGLDLTNGNYVVRHYVANATVKGYGKEDIIEMSERVLGGEYSASEGYWSYLDKDYEDKLFASGFEYPNFFEAVFGGQFVLQHHYLQIVNLDTNECGGYLHLYPKDETDEFGVELVYEGLDNDFNVDDTLESGVIEENYGSGETHEEALEKVQEKEESSIYLSGVNELSSVLKGYASQIGNITSGISVLLSCFPSFVTVGIYIGISLLVIIIIVKVIRG